MNSENLSLNRTASRVDFKKRAGQNNHFLITVLVGLNAVEAGSATKNKEFSTAWKPKDHVQSARRSREYALNTSLAWIIDLVDVYRGQITKVPSVFSDQRASAISRLEGQREKLIAVASDLGINQSDEDLNLVLFGLNWRTAIIHSEVKPRIRGQHRKNLTEQAEHISLEHSGLDIARAMNSFEAGSSPTFKEVASFIAAAHSLVGKLDTALLATIDTEVFADHHLASYFTSVGNPEVFSQFWSGNALKTHSRLMSLLLQLGFSRGQSGSDLPPSYLNDLSRISARDARARFSPAP